MGEGSTNTMMDDIENLLLKKYQANLIAGRKDSAMAVSKAISDLLEPAFKQTRQLDKEEQATIVANVEKMSEQQTELERKSRISWYALIGVLLLCFVGYILYRRYVGHQLLVAHRQLKEAYKEVETNTATKERSALEQEIASSIQQTLTPTTLPKRKDVQTFAIVKPGKMQGSGFCDCLIHDDKLFFCAGDATGKGAQASALTAIAKAQFRVAAAYEDDPERIIAALDKGMKCFVGVLDLASGDLKTSQENYHLPLVMGMDVSRLTDEEQLQPGSLILLYTDGLTDALNVERKKFGEKRMMGAALQAMKLDATPQPFIDNMMEAVNRYTGDTEQEADISMLAIRYTKG
jgi:serine phosphatase RsbU (regulator of sigma subunit)